MLVLNNDSEQEAFCENVKFSSKTMYQDSNQEQAPAKHVKVMRMKWHGNLANDWTQCRAFKTRNFAHGQPGQQFCLCAKYFVAVMFYTYRFEYFERLIFNHLNLLLISQTSQTLSET